MRINSRSGHRVLTTAQAARFLGYSVRTLEDWRMKRRGPMFLKQTGPKNNRGEAFYLSKDLSDFAAMRPVVKRKGKKAKRK